MDRRVRVRRCGRGKLTGAHGRRTARVPWPPSVEDVLRGMVLAAGGDKATAAKQVYRRATLRWHPDKFVNKFGAKLSGAHREEILSKVRAGAALRVHVLPLRRRLRVGRSVYDRDDRGVVISRPLRSA